MKLKITLALIVIIAGIYFINTRGEYSDEDYFKAIKRHKLKTFEGRVVKKYIDENQHYFHKVVFNNPYQNTIHLDNQIALFKLIKVGDSLIKESGSFKVRIIRESKNLDTIYMMRFKKYYNEE
jgi:hypothetical protein|tara:strand:+ start:481 stop:849 length:369 start_codon:yes stop_codon:yes gene_type:complete